MQMKKERPKAFLKTKPSYVRWLYKRWLAKNDLYYLCKHALGMTDFAPLHQDMTLWDIFALSKSVEVGQIVARGHYKSSKNSVGRPVQAYLRDPGTRVALFTAGQDLGKGFMRDIKGRVLNKRLRNLFPEIIPEDPKQVPDMIWKQEEVAFPRPPDDARRGSTFTIITERSVDTGSHFDIVITDDIVNEKNKNSPEMRQHVKEKLATTVSYRDPPDESGIERYTYHTGTIYHYDDALCDVIIPDLLSAVEFQFWKESNGERFITDKVYQVPSYYTDEETGDRVFAFPEGGFNEEELDRRKDKLDRIDPTIFESQYRLRVISTESKPFYPPPGPMHFVKESDIPDDVVRVLAVDPAVFGCTNNETAISLAAIDKHGGIYSIASISGHMDEAEFKRHVLNLCANYEITMFVIENEVAFKIWVDRIEVELGMPVMRFSKQKTLHSKDAYITEMSGDWRAGKIKLVRGQLELSQQLETFPDGGAKRRDDSIEAFAIAWHYLQDLKPTKTLVETTRNKWDEIVPVEETETPMGKYPYFTGLS